MAAPVSVSSAPSGGSGMVQRIRGIVSSLLEQHFKSTLGSEQGMVDYFMALMKKESSLNPNGPKGALISDLSSSRARDYMNSPGVRVVDATATPLQRQNIQDGKRAHGLVQLMGWNIVRRGSARAQKCEFEQLKRQDLAAQFLVNAGDSITDKLSGEANMERSILGGLLLLEAKWLICRSVTGGWTAGGDTFATRLACAIGAYHGAAKPGTDLAALSRSYVASVMGGDAYRAVTKGTAGQSSEVRTAQAAASGPATDGGGNKGEVVGC